MGVLLGLARSGRASAGPNRQVTVQHRTSTVRVRFIQGTPRHRQAPLATPKSGLAAPTPPASASPDTRQEGSARQSEIFSHIWRILRPQLSLRLLSPSLSLPSLCLPPSWPATRHSPRLDVQRPCGLRCETWYASWDSLQQPSTQQPRSQQRRQIHRGLGASVVPSRRAPLPCTPQRDRVPGYCVAHLEFPRPLPRRSRHVAEPLHLSRLAPGPARHGLKCSPVPGFFHCSP